MQNRMRAHTCGSYLHSGGVRSQLSVARASRWPGKRNPRSRPGALSALLDCEKATGHVPARQCRCPVGRRIWLRFSRLVSVRVRGRGHKCPDGRHRLPAGQGLRLSQLLRPSQFLFLLARCIVTSASLVETYFPLETLALSWQFWRQIPSGTGRFTKWPVMRQLGSCPAPGPPSFGMDSEVHGG